MSNKDTIYRQAAIDAVLKISEDETAVHNGWVDPYYVMEMLKRLPSAQPERKNGKWIKGNDGYIRCSECGCRASAIKARFCHRCGADMRQ